MCDLAARRPDPLPARSALLENAPTGGGRRQRLAGCGRSSTERAPPLMSYWMVESRAQPPPHPGGSVWAGPESARRRRVRRR